MPEQSSEDRPTTLRERLTLDAIPADDEELRDAFAIASAAGVRIVDVTAGEEHFRSVTYEPFHGDEITDKVGLAICAFDDISVLHLFQTKVTDKTLKAIAATQSHSLKSLSVLATDVTDAGVVELCSKCTKLEDLVLNETRITEASVKSISELPMLRNLRIGWTPVTDEGLKMLAGIESLDLLVLMGTRITDRGLSHLYGHKKLRYLAIGGTAVTFNGICALREATPQLQIDSKSVERAGQ